MPQRTTLTLAYLAGRISGMPMEAGTVSRYLRLPQIFASHYLVDGVLRLRGRRFETDISHRLAYEVGRHRSSGSGWFSGGTFDRSVSGYQAGEQMQIEMERSSEIYSLILSRLNQKIASVSHDGRKFASWIDPGIPHSLHPDIERIFLRYVNPWLLTTPQDHVAFQTRCREVEVNIAEALK
tara:strand:+ start:298 stop:840 length:543 start_codon:yes stop_codon:yes gene_type:complete